MLCMGQSRLAGAGQTIYRSHILLAVCQQILLLSAVAGSITIAVGNRPGHGQGTLLMFAEISHTQDAGTVGLGVEIAQGLLLRVRQTV